MTEQQKTFGETVGMESNVPVKSHPDDLVECSDGTILPYYDVLEDCRGNYHSNEEDRHNADLAIVEEILNGIDQWVCEYCTENTDYADGYAHIVDELSYDWCDRIEEWVREECFNNDIHEDDIEKIVQHVYDNIQGSLDAEPEYDGNEYARYSGPGLCLASFEIGEYEEQVDISCFDELQALLEDGRLDGILYEVNCNVFLGKRRGSIFEFYTNPGGQWHFVVSKERMMDLFYEACDG